MNPSGITEDYCRCGHVASQHLDGEGECAACRARITSAWAALGRCRRFQWNETWEILPATA